MLTKTSRCKSVQSSTSSSPLLINNDPTKINPQTLTTPILYLNPLLNPHYSLTFTLLLPVIFRWILAARTPEVTPVKVPKPNRSKISKVAKKSENSNPNYTNPDPKLSNSAPSKSAKKSNKSAPKNPNPVTSPSPRKKFRERKFVVAKKNSKREKSNSSRVACKCNISGKSQKCLCVAYETLRASQEGFFRNRGSIVDYSDRAGNGVRGEEEVNPIIQNPEIPDGYEEKLGENDCLEKNGLDETDEVTSEMGGVQL